MGLLHFCGKIFKASPLLHLLQTQAYLKSHQDPASFSEEHVQANGRVNSPQASGQRGMAAAPILAIFLDALCVHNGIESLGEI